MTRPNENEGAVTLVKDKDIPFSEMTDNQLVMYFTWRLVTLYKPLDPDSPFFGMSDIERASLFVCLMKGHLIWNITRKKWMVYSDTTGKWVENESAGDYYAGQLGFAMKEYYKEEINENELGKEAKKDYRRKLSAMMNTNQIKNYLQSVKAANGMNITDDKMDADPNIINCLNGELHLDDFQIHPHNPYSYCTKSTNAAYEPYAFSDLWDHFVCQLMCDRNNKADIAKLNYFQIAMGYSIDGTQNEKNFFVL